MNKPKIKSGWVAKTKTSRKKLPFKRATSFQFTIRNDLPLAGAATWPHGRMIDAHLPKADRWMLALLRRLKVGDSVFVERKYGRGKPSWAMLAMAPREFACKILEHENGFDGVRIWRTA